MFVIEFRSGSYFVSPEAERGGTLDQAMQFASADEAIPTPETPPLYASEAAALEDLTTPRGYAAADWSKDL